MDVRQVVNALEIIEYFADRGRPATLSDLVKHFGWPKSSIFNLITTLLNRGYLFEPRAKEGYYPSPLLLALAQRIDRAWPVPQTLLDLIQGLSEDTGETTVLAGVTGQSVIFLAVSESSQMIRYAPAVGYLMPLHATATGRALMSQFGDKERAVVLGRAHFHRFTAHTLMDAESVEREIAVSVARGYFISKGEHVSDLGGIAIPLQLNSRHLAVLVAGPLNRMVQQEAGIAALMRAKVDRCITDLRETAKVHEPQPEANDTQTLPPTTVNTDLAA